MRVAATVAEGGGRGGFAVRGVGKGDVDIFTEFEWEE